MYHAKKLGKKQWVLYQKGMEHSLKRMSIVAQQLSFALENKELELYYQPIIDYKAYITPNRLYISQRNQHCRRL